MAKRGGYTFDDRKNEILAAVVRSHVATGQPVGSFALARQSSESLSSATIRNICAELEDEGYLTHPHTSAGRVPTDKGYRYYVDSFAGSPRLPQVEAARIRERLVDESTLSNPEMLMERASRLLSQLSDNVGIVVSPSIARDRLDHLGFVKLPGSRILVISVSTGGRVQNCVIRVDEEFSREELDKTANYLMENFRGRTLAEIRDALYDKLLRNAVVLCSQSLQEGDQPDVFIEGASNILAKPDFADTERMRALFRMFEEKSRMVKILNECIEGAERQAVSVRIGSENRATDMRDCAVIASRFFYTGGEPAGSIGVVGPTRLEYGRLIGIVDYVSRLFEQLNPGASLPTRSALTL
jgi:heat-inducible transcriptional repressor